MDFLIEASKKETQGRKFSWTDPNADYSGSIGLGLPDYINIAKEQTRILLIERAQIQGAILQKVDLSLNEIDLAIKNRSQAIEGRDIELRRIARITNNMKLGISYALADLVTALQGKVKDDILLTDSNYRYLLAWTKLNRLIYSGPYTNLGHGDFFASEFKTQINSAQP
jgi:hypothetical protein